MKMVIIYRVPLIILRQCFWEEKDQKQLRLTKMKVFLKPNCWVQIHANRTINRKVIEDENLEK